MTSATTDNSPLAIPTRGFTTHMLVMAAIANTVFFWSSALVGIHIGLRAYSPGALALLRYLIASGIMTVIYFSTPHRTRIQLAHIPRLALMGICGIGLYNIALNTAQVSLPTGIAGFILGLIPVFTVCFASVYLKERLCSKTAAGLGVSLIGISVIAYSELSNLAFEWGLLECIAAAMLAGAFTTLQRSLVGQYKSMELVCFTMWFGTLLLLIYLPELLPTLREFPLMETSAVIYLGIFPGVLAYVTWAYALARIPASKAVSYMYYMPLICVVLGYTILSEVPETLSLCGGIIALIGAVLANRSKRT